MATKPPSAAQLAARKKFAEMARNGSLNRKRQIAAKKKAAGAAKPNPVKKTVSPKPARLASVVKRNPATKKSIEVWEVAIMKPGIDKKWIPIAHYFRFQDAEKYATYLHKKEKLDVRVITSEM